MVMVVVDIVEGEMKEKHLTWSGSMLREAEKANIHWSTLGGMRKARDKAKAREQRRYRRAKRGKVARRKAELGESGMRAIWEVRRPIALRRGKIRLKRAQVAEVSPMSHSTYVAIYAIVRLLRIESLQRIARKLYEKRVARISSAL
ncbi:hypothetical protein DFJ58DRAFT_847296 [Suillus subalutaceus]|uniref:uncharacterized protein n=1 Tax=Suillus subalutaceus TaxID=48586 RepID=UPI001B860013|nr:uncharacterized protein DFJ58DRAFT_847296 [Suillus subalutaceus]KAG1835882.1 hypothetical protein DFJ58DRAFT_847296 [Suillus subalutaceus]